MNEKSFVYNSPFFHYGNINFLNKNYLIVFDKNSKMLNIVNN